MRKLVSTVWIAGLAIAGFAALAGQDALAGQITASSGPIKVNGKPAVLPVTLQKNDKVETGSSTATFKSDAGDVITLDRGTTAKGEGTVGGIEYIFIVSGSAIGNLSEKTTLGVATSWATAPQGARTEVRVEAPAERAGTEGRYRTLSGGTWLRSDPYSVWLPPEHSVTLWKDAGKKGSLCFRTSQQNQGTVDVSKEVSAGNFIRITVPRAASGCVEDWAGNKTKVSNEITSNKQEKIHVETTFGSKSEANLGPGTYALIDNQTGGIEVIDDTIDDSIGEELPSYDPVDDASDASVTRRTRP